MTHLDRIELATTQTWFLVRHRSAHQPPLPRELRTRYLYTSHDLSNNCEEATIQKPHYRSLLEYTRCAISPRQFPRFVPQHFSPLPYPLPSSYTRSDKGYILEIANNPANTQHLRPHRDPPRTKRATPWGWETMHERHDKQLELRF